ncbi:MAG: histidine kinase, partial [Lachnospiraceae bacterium]|nr:histidine kinase [Lachnospiraceae bacterium]
VNLSSKREDEFGLLSDTFDEMTKELKSYMELQVKQQKELNEANLEMMQAQLNPHFLYNTLDTMKWVAKANKVPVIADLSSDLASILRTAISGGTFIKLSEELKLVDAYVNIQKIRFSDKFDYDVEVPMELEDMIVPKLIIQPIVENSIIHGFRDRASGQIFVNIYEEDGVLNIEVTDDGNGMTDEQLMIINAGEPLEDKDGKKKHIGIYNVSTILKLNYGKEYGLRAEAVSDGGTKTTIRIPAERERNV